jgi:hypothetical protein
MFGRRILVLVAVLMGLTALAASLAPAPRTLRQTPPAASTATPAPAPAAPASSPDTVTASLAAGPRARPRVVRAREGDIVQLDVSGNVVDTVVIPGLAVAVPIDPASPAQLQLFADAPGRYPISLLDSGRRLGVLRVSASS